MLGCNCHEQDVALQMLPQLAGASSEHLNFYIQGVRTGLAIRAAETAKWTRLGVVLALTFGVLTFMKHFGE